MQVRGRDSRDSRDSGSKGMSGHTAAVRAVGARSMPTLHERPAAGGGGGGLVPPGPLAAMPSLALAEGALMSKASLEASVVNEEWGYVGLPRRSTCCSGVVRCTGCM
jgi:hypothetical protein